MRFPKLGIPKEHKNTVLGSAIAGAVVGVETGLKWATWYPPILDGGSAPNIVPRAGFLIADLAPAGYAYMTKKKGGSAKKQDMANGMLLYDLPKLLDNFVYGLAYNMGKPAAGLAMRSVPMRLNIRPAMVNGIAAAPVITGVGKYQMKVATKSASLGGTIGKYR